MKPAARSPRRSPRLAAPGRRIDVAALLVAATLLVPPLLFSPTRADAFDLPKLLAAELLGLASLLALAWRLRAVERVDFGALVRRPAVAATVPVVAAATVGLALSAHPAHVRTALPDLWIGAACLIGWSVGLSPAVRRRLVDGMAVPAALLALIGIAQFHGLYRPFLFTGGEETSRLGVTSLAGNAGLLGAYLVLPVLIAQAGWWRSRRGDGSQRRRWLPAAWLALLALCLYGLLVTQTLAALAALALGSLVFWALAAPGRRLLVAVAVALGLALAATAAIAPLRARVTRIAGLAAAGEWNRALSGRLDGWRAAAYMMAGHPWTGVGHGAYAAEFAPAKLALSDAGESFYPGKSRVMFADAHNELLQAGAEWGLLGLAALGWALWRLLAALRHGAGADPPRSPDAALAWAGAAALAALALAHFPFRVALTAYPALLFLAWALARGEREGAPAAAGEGA